jgi:hypothetical protein
LLPTPAGGKTSFPAEVQVVEPLGSTMDVFLQTPGGQRLVARAPAAVLEEGATVRVHVPPEQVRLFAGTPSEGDYGQALA